MQVISEQNATIPLTSDSFLFGEARGFNLDQESLAYELWQLMDKDQRRQILYDYPDQDRKEEAFYHSLKRASLVCFMLTLHKSPRACAWSIPTCENSRTSAVHFAFAGIQSIGLRMQAGRMFIDKALEKARLLLGLIPRQWYGARAFALSLGFMPVLFLPHVCYLASHKRNTDFILYALGRDNAI